MRSKKRKSKKKLSLRRQVSNRDKVSSLFIYTGLFFIVASITLFIFIFFPVGSAEVNYRFNTSMSTINEIIPIDDNFDIIIPKIKANARIIANVNPFDEKEYQRQLAKGVAHALGTVYPGQTGNTFLFAHSSGNWFEANRYNSVFYLLHKLVKGDEIYLYYNTNRYKYLVKEIKKVDSSEIDYLTGAGEKKTLSLMTCWPPGTTIRRLLIIAEQVD